MRDRQRLDQGRKACGDPMKQTTQIAIASVGGEKRGALVSPCGVWRYWLARRWNHAHPWKDVCFIGLNPSTADGMKDDATVRRWRGYAKSWGYDGFWAVNLYGLRSTQPKILWAHHNATGPENDEWIVRIARKCRLVVACWGNNAECFRVEEVRRKLARCGIELYCIAETKSGRPAHPLRLSKTLQPQRWPAT
jgi:hypothetical protein